MEKAGRDVDQPLNTCSVLLTAQVGYNIGGPALNQLANISDKRESSAKGAAKKLRMKMRGVVSALVGLSAASLLATPQADAASEAFQLAAGALAGNLHTASCPGCFSEIQAPMQLAKLRCGRASGVALRMKVKLPPYSRVFLHILLC